MSALTPYLCLAAAIVFEVIGTSSLKESEGLTRLVPSLVTAVAYAASFAFLAFTLKTIPVGLAYAIWSRRHCPHRDDRLVPVQSGAGYTGADRTRPDRRRGDRHQWLLEIAAPLA
ncbi:MAG: hypothetical protein A49_30860 [Methyloceanibacter sp.]|nr:MAG: hypothetical protein A49_30860 [Methyloceanibacter sp.]